jgi:hypothetical protein
LVARTSKLDCHDRRHASPRFEDKVTDVGVAVMELSNRESWVSKSFSALHTFLQSVEVRYAISLKCSPNMLVAMETTNN